MQQMLFKMCCEHVVYENGDQPQCTKFPQRLQKDLSPALQAAASSRTETNSTTRIRNSSRPWARTSAGLKQLQPIRKRFARNNAIYTAPYFLT